MNVSTFLHETSILFKNKNISTFRLDAELLISKGLHKTREELFTATDHLKDSDLYLCKNLIQRRLQGEPIAYILGSKDFYKYSFYVQKGVLIPRPETELLVEKTVEWISESNNPKSCILDLGTGTGCIGLSLLKEYPEAQLVAVDTSETAIEVFLKNAKSLGVEDRTYVINGFAESLTTQSIIDSGFNFNGSFDVVVSNPPYIAPSDQNVSLEVQKYEPSEALYCLNGGLEKIQNWTRKAFELLRPKGFWAFEMGHNQSAKAYDILLNHGGFEDIKLFRDFAGYDRIITSSKRKVFHG